MKKCIKSVLLAICMVCLLVTSFAFADGETAVPRCGDGLLWSVDASGTLTVSGTGDMYDYQPVTADPTRTTTAPWAELRGSISKVVISAGVTSIGRAAFYDFDKLESVTMGEDVLKVCASAFESCDNLRNVSMGRNVTDIQEWAFAGCGSISGMTLYEGVKSIGGFAFNKCESLASITLPHSVSSIGISAFSDCSSLSVFTIPYGVTEVADGCFSGCESLYNVTIPDSVKRIGSNSFYNCSSLSMLSIPAGITEIGSYAFYCCRELVTMAIPTGVKDIGAWTFGHCSELKNISLPDGTEKVAPFAFYGCNGISNVYFGGTVDQWDKLALSEDNDALKSATLHTKDYETIYGHDFCGKNVTWILDGNGTLTISGTGPMNDYDFESINDNNITTAPWGEFISKIKRIDIREGVTSVGRSAFYSCSYVTQVTVPDSVLSIGDYAFRSCSRLKEASLGSGLQSIGFRAFFSCDSLSDITIPKGVTTIGEGAFCYCSSLTDIVVPNGVKAIEAWTFSNCTQLRSIVLGSSIQSIGSSAFSYCGNIQTIVIPENVTEIKEWAFGNCTSLKSVSMDIRVKSIAIYSFCGCNALTDVYYNGSKTQWSAINIGEYNDPIIYAFLHTDTLDAPNVTVTNNASSGKIVIKWSPVSGAKSYEVWRASSKTGTYSMLTSTTGTSCTNSGANVGSTYYYKVKSLSGITGMSDSVFSSAVSGTCACARPVIKCTNNASTGKIVVKWSEVDGAAKYEVWRATSKNGTYTKLSTTANTSLTNSSAKPGVTYYYKVKALGATAASNSSFSTVVSCQCKCAAPAVKISLSGGKPLLTWSAVDGAEQYMVYRATSKSGSYTKLGTTKQLNYLNSSATYGKTYYYKVIAVCASDPDANSAYSTVVSVKSK